MKGAVEAIARIEQRTAEDIAFVDQLTEARREIKEHRRNRRDEVADLKRLAIYRAFILWLDAEGVARDKERADAAGERAAMIALEIDTEMGFR